jgi:transketolase
VAAGVTLFEALKAYDELQKSGISVRIIDLYSIAPIDASTLKQAAKATKNLVLTVEDHYLHGGLGDAVLSALSTEGVRLHKMGVQEIAHSGKPAQLLDRYGISARAIIEKVKQLVS